MKRVQHHTILHMLLFTVLKYHLKESRPLAACCIKANKTNPSTGFHLVFFFPLKGYRMTLIMHIDFLRNPTQCGAWGNTFRRCGGKDILLLVYSSHVSAYLFGIF